MQIRYMLGAYNNHLLSIFLCVLVSIYLALTAVGSIDPDWRKLVLTAIYTKYAVRYKKIFVGFYVATYSLISEEIPQVHFRVLFQARTGTWIKPTAFRKLAGVSSSNTTKSLAGLEPTAVVNLIIYFCYIALQTLKALKHWNWNQTVLSNEWFGVFLLTVKRLALDCVWTDVASNL
jgi:hypothetical protein